MIDDLKRGNEPNQFADLRTAAKAAAVRFRQYIIIQTQTMHTITHYIQPIP